jgi:hypothetical protein
MARFASARISSFPHVSALIADIRATSELSPDALLTRPARAVTAGGERTHVGVLSGAIDRLLSWGQARTVDAGEAC